LRFDPDLEKALSGIGSGGSQAALSEVGHSFSHFFTGRRPTRRRKLGSDVESACKPMEENSLRRSGYEHGNAGAQDKAAVME
jgi:hypothetical protein